LIVPVHSFLIASFDVYFPKICRLIGEGGSVSRVYPCHNKNKKLSIPWGIPEKPALGKIPHYTFKHHTS